MDFKVTTRYAGKRTHATHEYGGFHLSKLGVEMHGYKPDEIVMVELSVIDHSTDYDRKEADDPNVYTGVYYFGLCESRFIYSHILATKVCSPSFFKNEIKDGEAVFVKLSIKEVKE